MTEGPTWDDVIDCVVSQLWKLAPEDYQRYAHQDLTFRTNMQDLREAVQVGVDDFLDQFPQSATESEETCPNADSPSTA